MPNNLADIYKKVFIPTYEPLEIVFARGKGCYLYDLDNNAYLDFAAGVAVSSLGHSNPILQEALHNQIEKLLHSSNIFMNDKSIELAELLVKNTFADKVFLCSSGLEANEAALKLARKYSIDNAGEQKNKIISFKNSFHGRSLFTVTVGGQEKYSQGFGDLPKDIIHIEFNDIEAFKKAIDKNTCAVILEIVQGEGGVIKADLEFLQEVRKLCTNNYATLIFDEVQTGIGRCGHLFAYQAYGVEPDILTVAKGLGAGLPIGAVLAKEHIAQAFKPGTHGSTYGGNPLVATAALVSFKYFLCDENINHIREVSAYLRSELDALNKKHNGFFKEIRNMGLLLGLEIDAKYKNSSKGLQKICADLGLLTLRAGENTLRLAPPLIISKLDVDAAIAILSQAIEKFLAS